MIPQIIMAVWLALLIGTAVAALFQGRRAVLELDHRMLATVAFGGIAEVGLLAWGGFWTHG